MCGAVIAVDDLLDWAACDEAIDAGYRHAIEKLEHLDKTALGGPW